MLRRAEDMVGTNRSAAAARIGAIALVALAVMHLHTTGASLVRTKLAEWGWPGQVLRWGLLLALVAGVVAGGLVALRANPVPEDVRNVWRPVLVVDHVLPLVVE